MSKTVDERILGPAGEDAKFDIDPISMNLIIPEKDLSRGDRVEIENKEEAINAQRVIGTEISSSELEEGVVFKTLEADRNVQNVQNVQDEEPRRE